MIIEYFKSLKLMKPKSITEFIKIALGIGQRNPEYESAKEELEKELDIIEVIKKIRKIEIAIQIILKSHHIKFLSVIGPCVIN